MTKNNVPAHGNQVPRSSIDARFQWNVQDIFSGLDAWKIPVPL